MVKAVNCATITLLPKIHNAIYVKDYRPMPSYTLVCKIIANILTNRLQSVITKLDCEA